MDYAKEALLDDEDDLEFHMTFPAPSPPAQTPGQSKTADSHSAVKRIVGASDPEPVVFLLGWSGCEDKQLAEYSRLYEDMGCATVRYTAPADYLYLSPGKIAPLARKLVELVSDMSMEASPVLVHAFGNNGAAVYQRMSQLLHADDAPSDHAAVRGNLRGVVFDSAPGQRTAADFLRGASDALCAQGYSGVLLLVLPAFLLVFSYLLRLLGFLLGTNSRPLDQSASLWCYDYLTGGGDQCLSPCLFLHSAADTVVSPSDVESAAKNRSLAGVSVKRVCLEEGEHVKLLQADREAYTEALFSFVSECLLHKGDEATVVEKEEEEPDKQRKSIKED